MTMNQHIDQEDLTLFALEFPTGQEMAEIQQHLVECAGCADAVAMIRGDLAALAMTVEMQEPPASARQRLVSQVARERKAIPVDRATPETKGDPLANRLVIDEGVPQRSVGAKVLPWTNWVGWAVAAGLTVAVTNLYRDRDQLRAALADQSVQVASLSVEAAKGQALLSALTDQSAVRVTLSGTPAKAVPQGHASYLAGKGSLLFTASNLEPLRPSKAYELWLIPADGNSPIPAGTFRPDDRGNASVIMPELPKGVVAKAFGVTIEDEGGSQKPTLPIILSGA